MKAVNKSVYALALALGVISGAQAATTDWQSNPQGRLRIISEYDSAPKNGFLYLGLHFQPAPGWYLYWKDPGEAGIPPSVKWEGSRGLHAPELLFPQPIKIVLPGDIVEYGYEGETLYPIRAKISGQPIEIQAKVSYLTCDTSCIPFTYTFTLKIPVSDQPIPDETSASLIKTFLARVPESGLKDDQIKSKAVLYHKMPGQPIDFSKSGTADSKSSLFAILLFAFVGGILLNVMPCVLPVLGIKLAGLVQHSGQAKRSVIESSLASAAGIVSSFLLLALGVILLRQAGHAIGWGIQFQNPGFVAFLFVVVMLFAFNLWGVFEIQMPRFLGRFATSFGYHESLSAHFTSGLFATLLATPCSAPFLGTAMGFALSQPAGVILSVFAAVGLGMAVPYFLLAIFPGSVRWLPRPGQWMITFKKGLAVLLFLTGIWLGWVLYQQTVGAKHEAAARPGHGDGWLAFDEMAISGYLNEGKSVFVDVTADWCVTCKYNERFVLGDKAVRAELARQGIVLMRADWTQQDDIIGAYLKKNGRAGIPFYALYRPGKPARLFSEILTKASFLEALQAS